MAIKEPDLIARLKGEHADVSTMMMNILAKKESADLADVRERQRVFQTIREKLTAHAKAEESVVYPAFDHADGPALKAEVEHSYDDHSRIELLLERLYVTDPGAGTWMKSFEELHYIVTAHVKDEETFVFPQARESITDAELKELDARYQTAEADEMQQVEAESVVSR